MSITRVAAHDNRALPGTPYGRGRLVICDLAVVGFVTGDELIKGPQPAVLLHLEAQRVVYPRADALGTAGRDGGLARLDQLSVHCGGQAPLASHTFMLHLSYFRSIQGRDDEVALTTYEVLHYQG